MFKNKRIPYKLDELKDTAVYDQFEPHEIKVFEQAKDFISNFRQDIKTLVNKHIPKAKDFEYFLSQASPCENNLNYLYLICLISVRFDLDDGTNYDCDQLAKNSRKVWEQYRAYFDYVHIRKYLNISFGKPDITENDQIMQKSPVGTEFHASDTIYNISEGIHIVHISDIHLSDDGTLDGKDKTSTFNHAMQRLKILSDSITTIGDELKLDSFNLLLITGDLVFRYYEGLYDNILLEDQFHKIFNDSAFKNILIIPGNHDFDKAAAIDAYSKGGGFYKYPEKIINNSIKYFYLPKHKFATYTICYYDFLKKFKLKNEKILNEYDPDDLLNIYSYEIENDIQIITYNSSPFVYASKKSYQDELMKLFISKCNDIINHNKYTILVGHHPLTGLESISQTTKGDHERYKELLEYISNNFNLYLHGHRHTNDASNGNDDMYSIYNKDLCIIGAGSQEEQGLRVRNLPKSFNLIKLHKNTLSLRTYISNSCSGPKAWSACTFSLPKSEIIKLKNYHDVINLRTTVKHIRF